MSKKYRPSNDSEGCWFMGKFCENCIHDKAYQDDPDNAEGCTIIANSMAFDVDDSEYPKEWKYQNGNPVCTKFEKI